MTDGEDAVRALETFGGLAVVADVAVATPAEARRLGTLLGQVGAGGLAAQSDVPNASPTPRTDCDWRWRGWRAGWRRRSPRVGRVPVPPGQPVIQLRVALEHVQPTVWRRLLVPGSVRLDKLHRMIQAAMGWEDAHLHAFEIGGERYGPQFDDGPEEELDERSVTVLRTVGDVDRFTYEYDFGDGWDHEVAVESVSRSPLGLKFGVCLAGEQACPPEDCGGPHGYPELLRVLADPSDEQHEDVREWVGGSFDPNEFDLAPANARLQLVR